MTFLSKHLSNFLVEKIALHFCARSDLLLRDCKRTTLLQQTNVSFSRARFSDGAEKRVAKPPPGTEHWEKDEEADQDIYHNKRAFVLDVNQNRKL
jgi:hypothetical protein